MGCETKGRRKLYTRIFPRNDVKDREDCNKMQNLGKMLMIAVASVCCWLTVVNKNMQLSGAPFW